MRFNHEVFWIQMHDLPLGCMTRDVRKSIGESAGTVERIDVNNDGVGYDKFLRVKILVDLNYQTFG